VPLFRCTLCGQESPDNQQMLNHLSREHKQRNTDDTLVEIIEAGKEELRQVVERCYRGQCPL